VIMRVGQPRIEAPRLVVQQERILLRPLAEYPRPQRVLKEHAEHLALGKRVEITDWQGGIRNSAGTGHPSRRRRLREFHVYATAVPLVPERSSGRDRTPRGKGRRADPRVRGRASDNPRQFPSSGQGRFRGDNSAGPTPIGRRRTPPPPGGRAGRRRRPALRSVARDQLGTEAVLPTAGSRDAPSRGPPGDRTAPCSPGGMVKNGGQVGRFRRDGWRMETGVVPASATHRRRRPRITKRIAGGRIDDSPAPQLPPPRGAARSVSIFYYTLKEDGAGCDSHPGACWSSVRFRFAGYGPRSMPGGTAAPGLHRRLIAGQVRVAVVRTLLPIRERPGLHRLADLSRVRLLTPLLRSGPTEESPDS